ncbi:DUF6017 domain-containing protein [Paludicola sp. MB14-C6]|uniref:DUF6017 domain-containing protein n=1 Tax=Paludihabitans sp. MB14-C6 TaxID=3070656 RepID=UPI0027DD9FE9|nr:DUF6017 domain-containing protein [Paludicola sp. MB14-C6]WMJ22932.1 DUF6017 domain-containing protein [Paludicola sp. MB14-C6]
MIFINNYFTDFESEQFTFFRVPKELFTNKKYNHITAEAKLLYGLLLDRMGLSVKNGWKDENGLVYIYYTIENIMESIGCGHEKACKLLVELSKADLIERRKQGQGRPTVIYVKKFISDIGKSEVKTSEKHTSRHQNFRTLDFGKTDTSNTNMNNTDMSDTNLSIMFDEMNEIVRNTIEYDILIQKLPYEKEKIDEITSLITDTLCTTKKTVRVSGNEIPVAVVRSRLLKITAEHVEYVIDMLNQNTTMIRNIKAYLLSALYNAPTTMDHYYTALVNHNFYGS